MSSTLRCETLPDPEEDLPPVVYGPQPVEDGDVRQEAPGGTVVTTVVTLRQTDSPALRESPVQPVQLRHPPSLSPIGAELHKFRVIIH